MDGRRSVRMFSTDPVPRRVVEDVLRTAGTAPSGAHKQPWTFAAVSDPDVKRQLREAAEAAEKWFYEEVAPEQWLRDLAPLGTDWEKTHLTDAPWVVVVFAQDYALGEDGSKGKHYYVNESVGIAVGFLLAAVRRAGLVALTHTPSPMGFLRELFDRPANERAYVVIPIGYAADDCRVPDLGARRSTRRPCGSRGDDSAARAASPGASTETTTTTSSSRVDPAKEDGAYFAELTGEPPVWNWRPDRS